jgi:hypothetical protein
MVGEGGIGVGVADRVGVGVGNEVEVVVYVGGNGVRDRYGEDAADIEANGAITFGFVVVLDVDILVTTSVDTRVSFGVLNGTRAGFLISRFVEQPATTKTMRIKTRHSFFRTILPSGGSSPCALHNLSNKLIF